MHQHTHTHTHPLWVNELVSCLVLSSWHSQWFTPRDWTWVTCHLHVHSSAPTNKKNIKQLFPIICIYLYHTIPLCCISKRRTKVNRCSISNAFMSTCDLKWNQNEYMKTLGKIAQDYAFVCWLKSRQAQCGALNVFLILTIELLNNLSSIMTALWKLLAYWWLWQCNCSSLFGVYFENRHSW